VVRLPINSCRPRPSVSCPGVTAKHQLLGFVGLALVFFFCEPPSNWRAEDPKPGPHQARPPPNIIAARSLEKHVGCSRWPARLGGRLSRIVVGVRQYDCRGRRPPPSAQATELPAPLVAFWGGNTRQARCRPGRKTAAANKAGPPQVQLPFINPLEMKRSGRKSRLRFNSARQRPRCKFFL